MTRDPNNFFTADDFITDGECEGLRFQRYQAMYVAKLANTLLRAHLATCPRVYRFEVNPKTWAWFENPNEYDTHSAILFAVRKLEDGK